MGIKLDFCYFPSFLTISSTRADLGYCGITRWFSTVRKTSDNFKFGLNCEPAASCLAASGKWSVEADVMIHLLNHMCCAKSIRHFKLNADFSRDTTEWCRTFDMSLFNENLGFLKDGQAVFQIQIGINKIDGLDSGNFVDFSVAREGESNVVLTVGENKFHVSKQILSMSSPVFKAMFNGNFIEKTMSEIPIHSVDFTAFHLLLQYIYMAPIVICEENVGQLLLMGDQFAVKRLTRECQNFLMRQDVDEKGAVELAMFHNLNRLLCAKIREKDADDLIRWESSFEDLPVAARNYLLEKLKTEDKDPANL